MEKANVASAGPAERWRINAEVCDLSYCPGLSVGVTHPVPLHQNATGLTFSLWKSRLMWFLAALSPGTPLFCVTGKTVK